MCISPPLFQVGILFDRFKYHSAHLYKPDLGWWTNRCFFSFMSHEKSVARELVSSLQYCWYGCLDVHNCPSSRLRAKVLWKWQCITLKISAFHVRVEIRISYQKTCSKQSWSSNAYHIDPFCVCLDLIWKLAASSCVVCAENQKGHTCKKDCMLAVFLRRRRSTVIFQEGYSTVSLSTRQIWCSTSQRYEAWTIQLSRGKCQLVLQYRGLYLPINSEGRAYFLVSIVFSPVSIFLAHSSFTDRKFKRNYRLCSVKEQDFEQPLSNLQVLDLVPDIIC